MLQANENVIVLFCPNTALLSRTEAKEKLGVMEARLRARPPKRVAGTCVAAELATAAGKASPSIVRALFLSITVN